MQTKKTALAIMVVLGAILTSCYWKNWDTVHGISTTGGGSTVTPCTVPSDSILYGGIKIYRPSTLVSVVDTGTKMSYSIDIQPIINASCATTTACHGSGASGLAKDYSTFAGVHSDSRGDTAASTLYSYISPGAPDPMPKTGAKLTTCEYNKIRNWIHQGAQNN